MKTVNELYKSRHDLENDVIEFILEKVSGSSEENKIKIDAKLYTPRYDMMFENEIPVVEYIWYDKDDGHIYFWYEDDDSAYEFDIFDIDEKLCIAEALGKIK